MTELHKLCETPSLIEAAIEWFSSKWGIPAEAYRESIGEYLKNTGGIPQWYVVTQGGRIIAGAGIIKNDFHARKDLAPNLCALFVEEQYRGGGIARRLLDFARRQAALAGFDKLYLITEHTEFYEKCGWEFLCMVSCDDGYDTRMYISDTIK